MPKFLDVPQWYNTSGSLVTGASTANLNTNSWLFLDVTALCASNSFSAAANFSIFLPYNQNISSTMNIAEFISILSGIGVTSGTSFTITNRTMAYPVLRGAYGSSTTLNYYITPSTAIAYVGYTDDDLYFYNSSYTGVGYVITPDASSQNAAQQVNVTVCGATNFCSTS